MQAAGLFLGIPQELRNGTITLQTDDLFRARTCAYSLFTVLDDMLRPYELADGTAAASEPVETRPATPLEDALVEDSPADDSPVAETFRAAADEPAPLGELGLGASEIDAIDLQGE
jgi:hypothetical protein